MALPPAVAAIAAGQQLRLVWQNELGAWIITAGLPGENAVTDRWKSEPATAGDRDRAGPTRLA